MRMGKELERQYIKGMRTTPVDPEFSLAYLSALIEECKIEGSRSVKGLLTQDQLDTYLGTRSLKISCSMRGFIPSSP